MGRDSVRRRRAADATGCLPTWFATSTLVKSNDAVVGRDPSTASDDWITPSRVTTGRASTEGRLVGADSRCAVGVEDAPGHRPRALGPRVPT